MNTIPVIFNSLLAPLPYFFLGAVGLNFCRVRSHVYWLSPLLGFCFYGLIGEMSLFFQLSMPVLTTVTLILAFVLFFLLRIDKKLPSKAFYYFYVIYLVSLSWNALVPYPGIGPWSGDWQENVRMGEAIWSGQYSVELLQRTPLYGGATAPLLLLQNSLASFQIASALCSSAVLLVFFFGAAQLKRKTPTWTGFLIVLLSPFYSHNAVYLWPKQMAAGCLLASFFFAWKNRENFTFKVSFASAFWFALAVSSHQSSIFYIPIWLVLIYSKERNVSHMVKDVALLAVLGFLLAGSFEAWAIHTYGLEARIHQNPSVYYVVDRSIFGEFRLLLVNSMAALTGWFPYSLPLYLEQHAPGWGIFQIATKVYLTLGVWSTWVAATFLGLLLPFVLAFGDFWKRINFKETKAILLASAVVFVLINLVQATPTGWGVTQTGFVGMCMAMLFFLVTTDWSAQQERSCLKYTFLIGTLPTLLSQTTVLFLLKLPIEQLVSLQKMVVGSEYDARYFFQQDMVSLGLNFFPFSLILTITTLALFLRQKKTGLPPLF